MAKVTGEVAAAAFTAGESGSAQGTRPYLEQGGQPCTKCTGTVYNTEIMSSQCCKARRIDVHRLMPKRDAEGRCNNYFSTFRRVEHIYITFIVYLPDLYETFSVIGTSPALPAWWKTLIKRGTMRLNGPKKR